jgi:NADPH2:quinone reductase
MTSHAIRQHEFGPPEVLRYEEVPEPEPAADQVRVAVEASGVHLIDTEIRNGEGPEYYARPELPMIPGREVAGVVDAVGTGVDQSWVGRRVVERRRAAPSAWCRH